MTRPSIAILLALSAFSQSLFAQFSTLDTSKFGEEVARGNIANAQVEANTLCAGGIDSVGTFANSASLEDRDKAIQAAKTCVNTLRNVSIAKAKTPVDRMVLLELLRPYEESIKTAEKKNNAAFEFMGLNFGIGLGFSIGDSDAVDDAEIVNGTVRVKSSKKEQPRVVFEFHKYMWCKDAMPGKRGCGPFVAIAASQDKVLSGVGMGFMYRWRESTEDPEAFSVGAGIMLDAKVKNLADGFAANQAPPAGETTVRFEEKSRWSLIVFVTRTF